MATLSAFSTPLHLISKTHFNTPKNLSFYPNSIHFQTKFSTFSFNNLTLSSKKDKNLYGIWKLKSSEEEETAVPEQEQEQQQEETASVEQQESVSVPVSPSDIIRMYFQVWFFILFLLVLCCFGLGKEKLNHGNLELPSFICV